MLYVPLRTHLIKHVYTLTALGVTGWTQKGEQREWYEEMVDLHGIEGFVPMIIQDGKGIILD